MFQQVYTLCTQILVVDSHLTQALPSWNIVCVLMWLLLPRCCCCGCSGPDHARPYFYVFVCLSQVACVRADGCTAAVRSVWTFSVDALMDTVRLLQMLTQLAPGVAAGGLWRTGSNLSPAELARARSLHEHLHRAQPAGADGLLTLSDELLLSACGLLAHIDVSALWAPRCAEATCGRRLDRADVKRFECKCQLVQYCSGGKGSCQVCVAGQRAAWLRDVWLSVSV